MVAMVALVVVVVIKIAAGVARIIAIFAAEKRIKLAIPFGRLTPLAAQPVKRFFAPHISAIARIAKHPRRLYGPLSRTQLPTGRGKMWLKLRRKTGDAEGILTNAAERNN